MGTGFLLDVSSWSDGDALARHGGRLAVIILLLLLAEFLFRRVVGRMFIGAITRAAVRGEEPLAIKRRADTLLATLNWGFGLFLVFLGVGLVLSEAGLNVSALIAGVGVVGIALGLGAQTLVKDVINGMFILIEDQYSVGDTVTVAGATGEVVEINPRRTVVRDSDGNLHTIPNSAISVAVNRTPGLNRVRVEVDVAFRDVERTSEAIAVVLQEMAADCANDLLAAPRVAATRAVGGGDARIVIVADARPRQRWPVEAGLRRRLKRRLDANRIEARLNGAREELPPKP